MSATTQRAEKPTALRILDAAEDLFAEQGYSATSLGEVADRVGIRPPSLYNHFRNKEALYKAVLDRLLADFSAPLQQLRRGRLSSERIFQWLETTVRMHHERPNLARLLQHAALSGGPQMNQLIEQLFSPMFEPDPQLEQAAANWKVVPGLQPWAVMALNNMVMSYVTMAPMYRDLLGEDPFSPDALDKQLELILKLAHLVLDNGATEK